jgi:hypothetical protein
VIRDVTINVSSTVEGQLALPVTTTPEGIPLLQESGWLPDWFFLGSEAEGGEGTWAEWNSIIKAIQEQRSHRAGRRLAVTHYEGHIKLYSPRNCNGPDDCIRINRSDLQVWIKLAQTALNANINPSQS